MNGQSNRPAAEQMLYASLLEKGMLIGLVLMFITFALYLLGIMEPVVPHHQVAGHWDQPVQDYLSAVDQKFLNWDQLPTGWAWLKLIHKGDFLNFVPVAILSGVTIVCFLAIAPGLFRRGDKAYGIMALLEAAILALAASGLLAVGH